MPVVYVGVNMEPDLSWQGSTDSFLRMNNVRICGNDYVGSVKFGIRNLFAPPNATNSDPRPVFVAINGLTNSPSHRPWQVLISDFSNGGGAANYSAAITRWRAILDSVQAPPPRLTNDPALTNGFSLTLPGQRGRTNVLEATTDPAGPAAWVPVTNFFGTNAPVQFRDLNVSTNQRRFYRVRRL